MVVKEFLGPVKLMDLSLYGAQSDRDTTQSRQRGLAFLEFVDQGSRRKDGPKIPRKNVSPAASLMTRAHALEAELLLPYWISLSVLQYDQRFSVLASLSILPRN